MCITDKWGVWSVTSLWRNKGFDLSGKSSLGTIGGFWENHRSKFGCQEMIKTLWNHFFEFSLFPKAIWIMPNVKSKTWKSMFIWKNESNMIRPIHFSTKVRLKLKNFQNMDRRGQGICSPAPNSRSCFVKGNEVWLIKTLILTWTCHD